ncbi:hypothetical protein Goari_027122 [Gossypium aridum]|uniref:Uncharacterized protein n=1 Tax=Gossypium aridum TaxID=34290 RepID=A0A7J8YRL4_GOSAI|nr:hypothetical protein [Gossypium aridum]
MDMVPIIEEYSTLLHHDFKDLLRIYWKQNVNFWGPLANLMGLPSDIRDDMGKTSDDKYLTLFAFAVCRLIMFLKALACVRVLFETIISLNFIRRKGDGHLLG